MSPLTADLSAPTGQPPIADPVRDVSVATFMAEVVEASRQNLVIVDFWAPWCGPCKQLGPALEKVVRSYQGAVKLAKVDIDQNPQIAQQLRVQSIPAVFAFYKGQPVDGFMGTQPESQIIGWIDRLIQTTGAAGSGAGIGAALKQAAEFLEAEDVDTAQSIYTDILHEDPQNPDACAGTILCLLAAGHVEQAQQAFESTPADIQSHKAFEMVRTKLELLSQTKESAGALTQLEAALASASDNLQARFDLALAYYGAGRPEDSVDQLLDIVRKDRKWNDEAARKQLVKMFEAFGPTHPLTIETRKRLSSILFS